MDEIKVSEGQEINELQVWKTMMDSMVKFIEASTRLMNTFSDKAVSQFSLFSQNKDSTGQLQTLLAPTFPQFNSSNSPTRKIKICRCSHSRNSSRPGSAPVSELNKINGVLDYIEGEGNRCTGKCASCVEQLSSTEVVLDRKDEVENDSSKCFNPESPSVELDEISKTPEGPVESPFLDCSYTSVNSFNVIKEPTMIPTTPDKKSLKEEEKKPIEGNTEGNVLSKPEQEISDDVQIKLKMAQQEIDDLKKELKKLQFIATTKNTNASELYKEIMKESNIEQLRSTAHIEKCNQNHKAIHVDHSGRRVSAIPPEAVTMLNTDCSTTPSNWQPTLTQARSPYHRNRQGAITCDGKNVTPKRMRPHRRMVQTTSGYQEHPLDMYPPLNYQSYINHNQNAQSLYPVYARPGSSEIDARCSTRTKDPSYVYTQGQGASQIDIELIYEYVRGDHNWHPTVYQHQSFTDDSSYNKEDYLSDDASCDDYICDIS